MAITNIENTSGGGGGSSGQIIPAKVGKIILDGSTEFAAQYGGYDAVGTIFYTRPNVISDTGEANPAFDELNIDERFEGTARPLFPWMKYYPLINEIVLVISSTSRNEIGGKNDPQAYYFPSINIWNHPHHNALPTLNKSVGFGKNISSANCVTVNGLTNNSSSFTGLPFFFNIFCNKPVSGKS